MKTRRTIMLLAALAACRRAAPDPLTLDVLELSGADILIAGYGDESNDAYLHITLR